VCPQAFSAWSNIFKEGRGLPKGPHLLGGSWLYPQILGYGKKSC